METKSDFSPVSILRDDKKELIALRNGLFPNESIHGFVNHMIQFFKAALSGVRGNGCYDKNMPV